MSAALRRGQVTRAVLVLLAVGLALLAGVAVAPTGVATTSPSPAATTTWPISVQVTEVSPAVLRPGDDLTVTATLRNEGAEPVASPSAILRLSRNRLHTRTDLQSWAAGKMAAGTRVATDTVTGPLEPGDSVDVVLTVAAQDVRLLEGADVWGPRGISIDARAGTRLSGQQRTYLLWLPSDDVPATGVSVAVPVVGPPASPAVPAHSPQDEQEGDGAEADDADQAQDAEVAPEATALPTPAVWVPDDASAGRLEEATASGERLAQVERLLAAAPDVSAVVDPSLLSLAAGGGSHARAWSAGMTTLLSDRDVLALPWADPDVAAVAHAARPDLVAVAASTARPWAELAWGADVPLVLWSPATADPDGTTAAVTANAGAEALVLPAGAVEDADETATPARTQLRGDGTVAGLAPDPVLTHLLTDPRSVEPDASPATAVQRTLAELAVAARQSDTPPDVLLAPDRDWVPDVTYATTLLDALDTAPWVDLQPVSALLDDRPQGRTTLPDDAVGPTELTAGQVQTLAAARERVHAFADVTADPDEFLAGVDPAVLAPLSVAWRTDPTGRDALVAGVVADVDERTSGLSIQPLSDVRVIGAVSGARMTVLNTLDVPVTVQLVVTPRKSCLQVEPIDPVEVDAQGSRSVPVELTAHANCEVRIVAHLASTAGAPVSAPVEFTARVQPTIESVGTVVVGVLLAVGLLLGIVRTVRRGQSARRGARTEAEAEADAPVTLGVLGGVVDTGEQSTVAARSGREDA